MENLFLKIDKEEELTREDALGLLAIENGSEDYYRLLSLANQYSRKQYKNQGVIFSQIGIDSQACSVNCKFCTMALDSYDSDEKIIKSIEDVVREAKSLVKSGTMEVFLMTTANFDYDLLLDYVKEVRKNIPQDMNLVVNTGDFNLPYAIKLKELGVTGAYHICRLGEGVDSQVSLERRIKTLDAMKEAGLELYYCVEPIGPEHSDEEIVGEIFRAKDYPVQVMAAMKRVAIPGTEIYDRGEINLVTLAKIVAVTTLAVRPQRAMGVHEPDILSLVAGANQIYAECGSNPRDLNVDTEEGRGFTVKGAQDLLKNAEWD